MLSAGGVWATVWCGVVAEVCQRRMRLGSIGSMRASPGESHLLMAHHINLRCLMSAVEPCSPSPVEDGGSEWCMETDAFTGRRPTHTIASQTTRVALVDAAVNTSIVMEEFSFRCIACSKPPPGPRYYSPDRCSGVNDAQ